MHLEKHMELQNEKVKYSNHLKSISFGKIVYYDTIDDQ